MTAVTLTLGLVGCGNWGKLIYHELLAMGHRVKVFDPIKPDISNIDWIPSEQLSLTLELESANCDALIIATPASQTPETLRRLVSLDLPTFVEKPLGLCPSQLSFLDPKEHSHVKMMHIWRYHPAIEALRDICTTEQLGEIKGLRTYRSGWTSPRKDVDSLWNLVIHDLTISKEVFGYVPPTQFAAAEQHRGVIRGAIILLGNQPYHWIEVSNRVERKIREVRVHGTDGVAVWHDDSNAFVTLYRGDDKSSLDNLDAVKIPIVKDSALRRELVAFVEFVRGNSSPKSDLEEGLELVNRISEIQRLIRKND